MLAGLYCVYVGGLPVLLVGLASIAASLAYSSGPFPLGDRLGLGDPLFFVFFGLVQVMATYYVEAASVVAAPLTMGIPPGTVTFTAFLASLPMAALTTNILVIDNIRDLEFDREKKEHTLAVLIGPRWSRVEYLGLLALAYAVPVWLFLRHGFGAWILLPLASIPYAVVVARRVFRFTTHEELIPMTPQAGQVLLMYAVLFAVGLVRG
jgi:1,4-dihydroxy-2-naphthoate octaprenyltransferase